MCVCVHWTQGILAVDRHQGPAPLPGAHLARGLREVHPAHERLVQAHVLCRPAGLDWVGTPLTNRVDS